MVFLTSLFTSPLSLHQRGGEGNSDGLERLSLPMSRTAYPTERGTRCCRCQGVGVGGTGRRRRRDAALPTVWRDREGRLITTHASQPQSGHDLICVITFLTKSCSDFVFASIPVWDRTPDEPSQAETTHGQYRAQFSSMRAELIQKLRETFPVVQAQLAFDLIMQKPKCVLNIGSVGLVGSTQCEFEPKR